MPGVSADLELTIDGALAAIDRIETALESAASTFADDLSSVLSSLSQPVDVPVTADVSAVETELAALEAAPVDVPVTADVSAVEAELAALDTTITVDANTAPAVEGVEELETAATAATESSGGLSSALGALSNTATASGGSAKSLASSVGGFSKVLGPAAIAVTALAAGTDLFFGAAVGSEAATKRFNSTFGETAGQLERINVGTLTTDLGTLNKQLGSSTSETKQALSTFSQFGQSFGATKQEAAATGEQLVALAANAVALDPSLGSVGQATEKLAAALRTGKASALAPFQLGLTNTQIEAKATEIALADGREGFNAFDKQAAGAALGVAKFGDSLKTNIAEGAKNPEVVLASLQSEIKGLISEIGKPLIAPVLDIFRTIQPAIKSVVSLFGGVVTAVLPVGQALIAAISPAITVAFTALGDIVKSLAPVFGGLTKIVSALSPIFLTVAAVVKAFAVVFDALGPVLKFVGDTLGLIAEGLAIILSPLTKFTDAMEVTGPAADAAADGLKSVSGEAITLAGAATSLEAVLGPSGDAFAKFTQTSTKFGGANVAGELAKIGVTTDVLQGQLAKGDAGLKEFTASAIESGRVVLRNADGTKISADGVRNYTGNLNALIGSQQAVVTTGGPVIEAFRQSAIGADQAANAEIKATAAQRGLSAAFVASLPSQAQYTLGTSGSVAQLQVLRAEIALADEALRVEQGTLAGNAAAFVNLTGQIAAGALTQENAAASFATVGLTAEQTKVFFDAAKGSVDAFVNGALGTIPTAAEVFKKLADATDPLAAYSLPANLKKQEDAVRAFSAGLGLLAAGGLDNLQAELARAGPAATAAFLQQAKISGPAFVQQAETNAASLRQATEDANPLIKASLEKNTVVLADGAKAGVAAYGGALDFKGVSKQAVEEAGPAITEANKRVADQAATAGKDTGAKFVEGVGFGIKGGVDGQLGEVRSMIQRIKAAADAEAQAKSPSLLFAELGKNIADGVAVGIADNAGAVVAEAEAIVRAAADAAASEAGSVVFPVALPNVQTVGGASGGTTPQGGVIVQRVDVSVVVENGADLTPDKAEAAGAAIAEGFAAQLSRQVAVDARTR